MTRIFKPTMFFILIILVNISCKQKVTKITIPQDATTKELLAASEIRRYIYLRSGELAEIISTNEIPSSEIRIDFEYYIEATAGNEEIKFPSTTPNINRTVVLIN